MNRKLIITKLREKIITAVLENEKIVEVRTARDADNFVDFEAEILGFGTDDLPF